MTKRTYDQYCALAAALDVLGERWTLLVVRNLLYGPKRFKDLHAGLPGIGTGLLSERLTQLDADGVIERVTLPPPASTSAYQLTTDGRQLHDALVALARWGMKRVGALGDRELPPTDVLVLALEASFDPAATADVSGVYELRISDTPYRIQLSAGELSIGVGAAEDPAATITTDIETLIALNDDTISPQQALAGGHIAIAGDGGAALEFAAAFGFDL